MSTPTLGMILNPPESENLSIPTLRNTQHRRALKMDLMEIEKKVGFQLMRPGIKNVTLISTGWVEGFNDYYGEFSDGIGAVYQLGENKEMYFVIHQYRIMNSDEPEIFNYPEYINAYQKSINNGFATIVLIPREWAMPFIEWVSKDMLVKIFFSWSVEEVTVETIINSLK